MNSSLSHPAARAALVATVVALAMAPLFAHAQLKPRGHICNNLDSIKERTMERVQARADRHTSGTQDRGERWMERKTERLARLEANRTSADTARMEGLARMNELAQTAEQQAAVSTFESSVDAAIETRRSAVDEAITAFEDASEALWEARTAAHETYAAEFEADMESLFTEAAAACEEADTADDALQMLRGDVEALRAEYQERAQDMNYRAQYQEAHDALRTQTQAAWETFRNELDAARTQLRAAFGA